MALKDTWKDLENVIAGVPDSGEMASADDINEIAHAVIDIEKNGVSTDTITPLIDKALTEAKESGEFDGEDGKPYAYMLTVGEDGTLYCEYADTDTPPNFVYDEESGYVYYVTENSTLYEVLDVNIIVQKVLGQLPGGGATTFNLMSIDNEIGTKDLVITDGAGQTILNMSFVRDDTDTATIMTVSNVGGQSVDITIKDGKDGIDGQNGQDGKDGQDYVLTGDDKNEIAELVKTLIPLDEYAKTEDIPTDYIKTVNGVAPNEEGNVTISATINPPDVVDSVEEMTDTSKQYVLSSTGTIWAYKDVSTTTKITETILTGFQEGKRINSSGEVVAANNCFVTPIIDIDQYSLPLSITLSGIIWTSSKDQNNRNLLLRDADGVALYRESPTTAQTDKYITNRDDSTGSYTVTLTEQNTIINEKQAKYFLASGSIINGNDGAIISTPKMDLVYDKTVTGLQWTDTGVPFSGKDYSKEISSLQADVDALKSSSGGDAIPSYVIKEAEEVADKILSVRNENSLVLLMASDLHINMNDPSDRIAIKHMGQGMKEICKHTMPDATVLLGDYVSNSSLSVAEAKAEIKYANKSVNDVMNSVPTIWLNGNHDCSNQSIAKDEAGDYVNRLKNNEMYDLIGSNNIYIPEVYVNKNEVSKNYGYIDFESQKIRLIYLNTSDMSDTINHSTSCFRKMQGEWLVNEALNLSGKKTDESNWGVIICSHHPFTSREDIKTILLGFVDKNSGSTSINNTSDTVNFNFTNVKAKFISHFHGHLHNFRTDTYVSSAGNSVVSITIPNACPTPSNYYGKDITQEGNNIVGEQGSYDDGDKLREVDPNTGKSVYYYKTAGTAEDTSFCAITVDRENGKIYAHCYGAGYDRKVTYKEV